MAEPIRFNTIKTLAEARAWVSEQREIRNDQIAILSRKLGPVSEELTELAESLNITFTGNPGR